jgi:hypothetical protein
LANGLADASWIDDQYNEARIAHTPAGATSWWWLRSPGYSSAFASAVIEDGKIRVDGIDVNGGEGGVRPALWVEL